MSQRIELEKLQDDAKKALMVVYQQTMKTCQQLTNELNAIDQQLAAKNANLVKRNNEIIADVQYPLQILRDTEESVQKSLGIELDQNQLSALFQRDNDNKDELFKDRLQKHNAHREEEFRGVQTQIKNENDSLDIARKGISRILEGEPTLKIFEGLQAKLQRYMSQIDSATTPAQIESLKNSFASDMSYSLDISHIKGSIAGLRQDVAAIDTRLTKSPASAHQAIEEINYQQSIINALKMLADINSKIKHGNNSTQENLLDQIENLKNWINVNQKLSNVYFIMDSKSDKPTSINEMFNKMMLEASLLNKENINAQPTNTQPKAPSSYVPVDKLLQEQQTSVTAAQESKKQNLEREAQFNNLKSYIENYKNKLMEHKGVKKEEDLKSNRLERANELTKWLENEKKTGKPIKDTLAEMSKKKAYKDLIDQKRNLEMVKKKASATVKQKTAKITIEKELKNSIEQFTHQIYNPTTTAQMKSITPSSQQGMSTQAKVMQTLEVNNASSNNEEDLRIQADLAEALKFAQNFKSPQPNSQPQHTQKPQYSSETDSEEYINKTPGMKR